VPALLLGLLALSFIANMAFVIVSRTALVTMPLMVAVFGVLHLRRRTTLIILCATVVMGVVAWFASPQLKTTVHSFKRDYQLYMQHDTPTSMGERLEYYRKSLKFFAEAPLIGHGTGSTLGLFEQAATGPAGSSSSTRCGCSTCSCSAAKA
jgi:O-antigen ligase